MKRYLKNFSALALLVLFISPFVSLTAPQAHAQSCGDGELFGIIPPWHKNLPCEGDEIGEITELNQLLVIGFNIVEMLLGVMVIAAVIFFIAGSIRLIASSGSPEAVAGAKKTLINAVVGLVLGLSAGSLVSFLSNTANDVVGNGGDTSNLRGIIELMIRVGAALAVIFVVKAAIQYTTSAGDASRITSAKNTLIYVVIGLVLLVSSYTILSVVVGSL